MYFLVRTVSGGSGPALDSEYQGDALTLGGDADAMVHLAGTGSLRIEVTEQGGGSISASKVQLEVNEQPCGRAEIGVDDVLTVPGYQLEIIAPPAGFDFALQLSATGAVLPPYSAGMDISEAAWSMRRYSWLAAGLILLLCLLFPLLGILDDGMWSTGPLASAHRTAGIRDTCEACHVEPFVMVQGDACLACHRNTAQHVDLARLENAAFLAEHLSTARCASCHREHNEPPQLVRRDKGLCVECHGSGGPAGGEVQAVSAFTPAGHPPFRLALLIPKGPGGAHGWEEHRVRPADTKLSEQSRLKFDHSVHLNADKVREQGSDAELGCDSCHLLKDDGEHFEPVTMEDSCRRCHSLNFDMFEPELELPHGNLRAAIVSMEAHFIREFTDPALRMQRARQQPRRVPGKREAAASCEGSGLDCGRAEALKEAEYQFANTGCISCHEVTETGLSDISDRWYVQPVRVTGDWYPHSRFNHRSHLNLALSEASDEVCENCHEAATSTDATDILIPAQDNCLQCHNEEIGEATVDCVRCHVFHPRGQGNQP